MLRKSLLLDSRFWASFWTQFLGAFNDNVFKNALVVLITFKSFTLGPLDAKSMVALCGGIFILPFFLFSAFAGQISDKVSMSKLMRIIKIWEVFVMLVGAYGFINENITVLLVSLFFMGLQSTFFGPVKYAILPELVKGEDLVRGNALVEVGTFMAILLGTILGGLLIALESHAVYFVSAFVILFAILGTLTSLKVPKISPKDSSLKIQFGLIRPTIEILKITTKKKGVALAVLGISWFWLLGAALLSMFPGYAKDYLNGDEGVVTLFLALFSIGIAVGSIICEKLSRERLELGLVPFGTIGISVFLFDLFIYGAPIKSNEVISVLTLLREPSYYRILVDLFLLSVFSGLFTVPLYTYIQIESLESERSRVIAGLNIINALFMVCSAIVLMIFYSIGLSMPEIFLIWSVLNLIVSVIMYYSVPQFMLRFWAMIISRIMYRVKVNGLENIPKEGACLLTCNHLSFVDWLILSAEIKRPIRFIMWYKFYEMPILKSLFRDGKVIPIAKKKEDPLMLSDGLKMVKEGLSQGDLICIFPEGEITYDGKTNTFKRGVEMILKESHVKVVPIVLDGMWGSFFSRKYNQKACSHKRLLFKGFLRKVTLTITRPWAPEDVSVKKLEEFTKKTLNER